MPVTKDSNGRVSFGGFKRFGGMPTLDSLPTLGGTQQIPQTATRQPHDPTKMPADLTLLGPSRDQVQTAADTRHEDAGQPWWAYLFSLPDQLLLGRSIRGFIRGMGDNSDVNPFEAFARGLPGAEAFDAELNTSFADIRQAYGDTDSEEGVGNFFVNLIGDVVLDPTTYLIPFGVTAKAAQAGARATSAVATVGADVNAVVRGGETALNAAQNVVPELAKLTRKNRGVVEGQVRLMGLTLEEQVQKGLKAAMVLHIPFTDIYKPLDVFALKSMDVTAARAVDDLFAGIRSNRAIAPLFQMVGKSTIADPKQHANFLAQRETLTQRGEVVSQAFLMQLQKMPDAVREQMLADPGTARILSTLMETGGFQHLDDSGMLAHVTANREAIIQAIELKKTYAKGGYVADLLDAAYGGKFDVDRFVTEASQPASRLQGPRSFSPASLALAKSDKQRDAIKRLMDVKIGGREIVLPEELFRASGLEPRVGIDIPFHARSMEEAIPIEDLDLMRPHALGAATSVRLNDYARNLIEQGGYDGYSDLVATANGKMSSSFGKPSAEVVQDAQETLAKVDKVLRADRLAIHDPDELLARRTELLDRIKATGLDDIQRRRASYQVAISNARAAGRTDVIEGYREALKAYDQIEAEVIGLERAMAGYVKEPGLMAQRFPGLTESTRTEHIEEMKRIAGSFKVGTTEKEVIEAATGGSTLRERSVRQVLNFASDLETGQTTPELADVRSKIKRLNALDQAGKLGAEDVKQLRGLILEQRQLIRNGARLGGQDLKDEIVQAANIHVNLMRGVNDAQKAAGLLNQGLEHYVPRIMNKQVQDELERRWGDAMERLGTKQAVASFMQGRKFTDLLTVEANTLMELVGSRVTNYEAVGELMGVKGARLDAVRKQLSSGGMAWTNVVFGPKWANKVIRPLDPNIADFFLANPLLADYAHVKSAGRSINKAMFMGAMFNEDNGMVKGSAMMGDTQSVADLMAMRQPNQSLILYDPDRNRYLESTVQDVIESTTDYSVNARLDTLRYHIREHVKNAQRVDGAVPDSIRKEMDESLSLVDRFKVNRDIDIGHSPNDTEFTRQVKIRLNNEKLAQRSVVETSEARTIIDYLFGGSTHRKAGMGAKWAQSSIASAQVEYHEILSQARKIHAEEVANAGDLFAPSEQLIALQEMAGQKADEIRAMADDLFDAYNTTDIYNPANRPNKVGSKRGVTAGARGIDELLADPTAFTRAKQMHSQAVLDTVERNFRSATGEVKSSSWTKLSGATRDELRMLERSMDAASSAGETEAAASIAKMIEDRKTFLDELNVELGTTPHTPTPDDDWKNFYHLQFKELNASIRWNARYQESGAWYHAVDARRGVSDATSAIKGERDVVALAAKERAATTKAVGRTLLGNVKEAKNLYDRDPATMGDQAGHIFGMNDEAHVVWDELPEELRRSYKEQKNLRLVLMDTDVYQEGKRHVGDMAKPDTLRNISAIRMLDGVREWWTAMTTTNPLFTQTRIRDITQNLATLAFSGNLDGAALHDSYQISKAVGRSMKNGTTYRQELGTATTVINGQEHLLADIVEQFQAHGLIGRGVVDDNFADDLARSQYGRTVTPNVFDYALGILGIGHNRGAIEGDTWRETVGNAVSKSLDPANNPVYRLDSPLYGRGMARLGDDTTRMAAAFNAMQQGMPLDQAALHAKKWTYGSGQHYTSTERNVLRRFIPFYGFMKWSTGTALDIMTSNSKYLGAVAKVRDNAYRAQGLDSADMHEIMPTFLEDNVGIPVINGPDGPLFVTMGSVLPTQALQDATNAIRTIGKSLVPGSGTDANDAMLYVARNLHPVAKMLIESASHRDMFSGRPLERFPGEKVEMFGLSVDPMTRQSLRNIRYLNDLDRMNILDLNQMQVAANAVPRGTRPGDRKSLSSTLAFLTGSFGPVPVRAYQVDVDEDARRKRAKDEQEMNKLKGYMRQAAATGKATSGDNLETLQALTAKRIAQIDARSRIEKQYGIDPEAQAREDAAKRKAQMKKPIRFTRGGYRE